MAGTSAESLRFPSKWFLKRLVFETGLVTNLKKQDISAGEPDASLKNFVKYDFFPF
jgi:hypothetical protein